MNASRCASTAAGSAAIPSTRKRGRRLPARLALGGAAPPRVAQDSSYRQRCRGERRRRGGDAGGVGPLAASALTDGHPNPAQSPPPTGGLSPSLSKDIGPYAGSDPSPAAGPPRGTHLKALVDAARRGDQDAARALVEATWQATFTLAYRLTGHPEDALDVTQEAYLRAFRGLPRFRGEARFTTWLYRVTANCASNHLARSKRSRHDELDLDAASFRHLADSRLEHDPEAFASACDERAVVAEALLALPRRLREVVVLRDIYDLSHRSIAAEIGISEAAAKVRLQRARKRLREDLSRRLAQLEGREGHPGALAS